MTYLTPYHKEKTERCLRKIKEWRKLPMTLEEQLAAAQLMKDNLAKGIAMQPNETKLQSENRPGDCPGDCPGYWSR